jgi:hypothetical protein
MRTLRMTSGDQTSFIVAEADPACFQALRDLAFTETADGFARSFPSASPLLDRAYDNFALDAEEMILQTARLRPVPWDRALEAFLSIVESEAMAMTWWLVGSTALAVRGLDITPRDIDLSVDAAGAHRLADLLADSIVQPVQATPDWFCDWFGRAFLHARIEWVGGVDARADDPEISDFGPTAASRMQTIQWRGHTVHVPPLELQLLISQRRGLSERVAQIQKMMESGG